MNETPSHPDPSIGSGKKRPVLRFGILFLLLTGAFQVLFYSWFTGTAGFQSYLNLCATASGFVIRLFGTQLEVIDSSLHSSQFTVEVRQGCDAIQPAALLVAGILAFPSPWRAKLWGIFLGTFLLQGINILRIVSLYYIGAHFPDAFEVMHVDVWQVGFIFLAMLLWMLWLKWAAPRKEAPR